MRTSSTSATLTASVRGDEPNLLVTLAFAPAFSSARTSSRSTLYVAHSSAVEPSGSSTFTSRSGEVIAASTASRLPSRIRSDNVWAANALPAKVSPSARRVNLNNVASEVGVVRPVAFAYVVEEPIGVLELAVQVVQHAGLEHV